MMNQLLLNLRESRGLAKIRELLVPTLMCGDIRLAKAEKVVEGTA